MQILAFEYSCHCFISNTACSVTYDTECIQGSYHIPFYCRRIKSLKGIEVVDGAYGFAGI